MSIKKFFNIKVICSFLLVFAISSISYSQEGYGQEVDLNDLDFFDANFDVGREPLYPDGSLKRRKVEAAPTVIDPISDQTANYNQPFKMEILTYDTFSDIDGDFLNVTVKQKDDSNLPSWLTSELRPVSLSLVGSYNTPGHANNIVVVGNYAYVADRESGLQIIDISIPSSPTLAGTCDTPGHARDVAVVGNYAYVADWDSGLQIIDISTPSNPVLVGTRNTPGSADGVAVVGDYAYVADDSSGLQIIDISTPSNPALVGSYNTPNNAWDVTVAGNYAYVADRDSGLQIIDISTPSNPAFVGAYNTPGSAYGVAVVDNHAYVADGDSGLQVIDISTPSSPALVGSYDTSGLACDVVVVGNHAYVADYDSDLQIIDISTPSNPTLVGSYSATGFTYGVSVVGNYAYVVDGYSSGDSGLQIIDIRTPSNIPLVGTYDTLGTAHGVTVVGNYVYVADGDSGGLQIIDISTPSNPTLVGIYNTPGSAYDVVVAGNYAYVADGSYGLQIIDISTPSNPTLGGSHNTLGYAYGVAVAGNYAYVADYDAGLQIIDISTPSSPVLVETYDTLDNAWDVAVVGNYAYVANWDSGLKIIDISIPSNPTLVGLCNTLGSARGVSVVGNYAYVADSGSGLQVIDISTPANPVSVGTYNTPDYAYGVAVAGNYAYVGDGSSGLQIIDISAPSNPTLVGTHNTPGSARGVSVVGNYVYVADGNSGLQVFEVKQGLILSGTPSVADIGKLQLKATASDGTGEVSDEFSIDVINAAPIVSAVPKSGIEDAVLTFSKSDFISHFKDANNDPLTKIQILNLPSNGTLKLSGVNVSKSQAINAADLVNLTFEPNANWYGSTSFSWRGSDGTDYSSNTANVNIEITNVPDVPTISDIAKNGPEDTAITFSLSDFTNHFSDVDGDSLTKIQILSLPSDGVLKLSEVDVVLNQEINAADLDNLTFEPDANWYGSTSFSWRGSDGTDYSSNTADVNIQINSVQDLPVVSDISKSANEDTIVTFTVSDFTDHFSDGDGEPLTKVKVLNLPGNGVLKLFGGDFSLDDVIDTTHLGDLTFEPDANWHGSTSFKWQGFDGTDYSSNTADVNIQISSEQDFPIVSDISKTGSEDTIITFSRSDFTDHFSDRDSEPLTKVQILSLPGNGVLKFSGVDASQNQEINVANLVNLTFKPNANWHGSTSFNWQGSDGTDYSSNTANVNIEITAVSDAPTVSDIEKVGSEDTVMAFDISDFTSHFSDVDEDSLAKVQILSLPNDGTLKLLGVDVATSQEINVDDLSHLVFDPDVDWHGKTSFSWRGSDGTYYSTNAADVLITIAKDTSSSSPTITDFSKEGAQNKILNFEASDFTDNFGDMDSDSLVQIQILGLPENGVLKLSGVNVEINQEIPVKNIDEMTFVPEAEWVGETNFGWRAYDGQDYSNEGVVNIKITTSLSTKFKPWMLGVIIPTVAACTGAVVAGAIAIPAAVIRAILVKKVKKNKPDAKPEAGVVAASKVGSDKESPVGSDAGSGSDIELDEV